MATLIAFVAGALVGWQFPQPAWVKVAIAAVKAKFSK